MEIVDRPFQKAAKNLGMTEEQIFEKLHHYEDIGVMRRYAAILRHREAGFTANGMIVWKVPEQTNHRSWKQAWRFSTGKPLL